MHGQNRRDGRGPAGRDCGFGRGFNQGFGGGGRMNRMPMSDTDIKACLQNQAKLLKERLDEVNKRLSDTDESEARS
ncbi:MAG: hypothetical protein PHZ09_04930 [Eubacteriales bacterium]|jgi:hypothetical protein|nr:hypothetical protein [Eubacteriales bacterium]